ncbi:hypothetical protein BGZ80_000471 [Entomortierella chlamydospora]|uniref:Uncharacterized protein n=1 Tax=Entomortierella chlamydospora TaxID=101097 RepID=A0A9P6T5P2_9FUNG|nr:hypothetical protein BGZ80_000471 [Entomortierella chlamydospora]
MDVTNYTLHVKIRGASFLLNFKCKSIEVLNNTTAFVITISGAPLSASSLSRGHANQWFGSTATTHEGMGSSGPDSEDDKSLYFGQNDQQRLHQSVSQLRVTDGENSPPHSLPRYGMVRNVSTTLPESIRAATAQEAKDWSLDQSSCIRAFERKPI